MKSSKLFISVLVIAFLICFATPALAAQVYVDGQKLQVSTASVSGTTLVPLRAIFQALGATVNWVDATQTVTATKAQTTIKLQIGAKNAYKNGQPVTLQVPGRVVSGSTMVPLRFVAEALGANVDWEGTSQTITINSSGSANQMFDKIKNGEKFYGNAKDSSSGKSWDFTIRFYSYNPTNDLLVGEIEWPSLNALHEIRGMFIDGRLAFEETSYIKEGQAALGVQYLLEPDGGILKGYWLDKQNDQKGTVSFGPAGTKETTNTGGGGSVAVPGAATYGVPNGLDLSAACPANGTWVANTERRAFTTPPTLSVGKMVVNNWLVTIYPVRWENTGVCTTVTYGGNWKTCSYQPVLTGQVIRGYIDPTREYRDSNNNIRYHGMTTEKQGLRFWDYQAPEKVYLNIDFFKNDKWTNTIFNSK